jgi:hypothetical protein
MHTVLTHVRLAVLLAAAGLMVFGVAWNSGRSPQNSNAETDIALVSVPREMLSAHNVSLFEPSADERVNALPADRALLIARSWSPDVEKAGVREQRLVHVVAGTKDAVSYDTLAWAISFEAIPTFMGNPAPRNGETTILRPIVTLDNTYYLLIVDARSGEILANYNGMTEPPEYEEVPVERKN